MRLDLVGLSWRTADLATRDRVAIGPETLARAAGRALSAPGVEGVVILSTCKRTELYLSPTDHLDERVLRMTFADVVGLEPRAVLPTFIARDGEAVSHLFRAAAGLDSPNVGEAQVLAQVRQAWDGAVKNGVSCAFLNQLFLRAIECGKRVQSETGLGGRAASVAGAALAGLRSSLGGFEGKKVLILGAGETARRVATRLHLAEVRISNRTLARAQRLALDCHGQVCPFPPTLDDLRWADVVISATGAPGLVLTASQVIPALGGRPAPLALLDLAVPRDIDPALSGPALLYTVDDFPAQVSVEPAVLAAAGRIVDERLSRFETWYRESRVSPGLGHLHEALEEIRGAEVLASAHRFHPEDREALDRFSRALVKRVMGLVAGNLRDASSSRDDVAVAMALTRAFAHGEGTTSPVLERMRHELSH